MIASQLPVYVDTFELADVLSDYASKFPKMYKYSLGNKIVEVSLELFEYIQLANRTTDSNSKARHLEGFLIKHDILVTLIRLSTKKHILTMKQSANLATLNDKIGRQITGWKKSLTHSRNQ